MKTPPVTFTPRELQVLQLVATEEPNKAIASRLGIHEKTVDKHRCAIMQRIGVNNAVGLAHFALAHRLVPNRFLS